MSEEKKIIAISYANKKYMKAARLNRRYAIKVGGADKAIIYSPNDIDSKFRIENIDILSQEKGNGYWLWKPYFLFKTLSAMDEGDILFYTDAACVCIDSIWKLIDVMRREKQSQMIFSLGNDRIESAYTKRDAFVLMDCDEERFRESPQADASVILFENNNSSREFCREYLEYAKDKRILTDVENEIEINYSDFKMHRHDQSILSLLAKKKGIPFFRDPSQYGVASLYADEILKRSDYPQILNHHRVAKASSLLHIKIKQLKIVKKLEYKIYQWKTR